MSHRTLLRTVCTLALLAALTPAAAAAPEPDVEVDRVAGSTRDDTASALAREGFPDGADLAYVATAMDFPDALAAGPAAAADGAPLLLVWPDEVPTTTEDALRDLGVGRVLVLGGGRAVGPRAEGQLAGIVDDVDRIGGADRFETAAAVARRFDPGVPLAYVANGTDFPDALAGGTAGAQTGGPVLLVRHGSVPEATREALEHLAPGRIVVLGGRAAVSDGVADALEGLTDGPVQRRSGPDRFATSVAIAAATFPAGARTAFLATGTAFPDGLAAGPVAGPAGAPLLLSRRDCVPGEVLDELDRLEVERVVLVGGGAALGRGPARLEPCGHEVTVVERELSAPWDVAFTPDGQVFVTERDTRSLLRLGSEGPEVVHTFAGVDTTGEGGLLGLAVSPDFEDDGYLYAYLTTSSDNRVVRLRPGDSPVEVEPVLTAIPRGASVHHGGRIAFVGSHLFVATGDAERPELAQDRGSLAGKILRVEPDGSVPPGNPFPGSPVYAWGLRNPQGLVLAGGQIFATEFGPGCDDEVNVVKHGANFGWPDACGQTRPGATGPIVVRQPAEASWSGLATLEDGLISPWEGDLFAAGLRGERLWRFRLQGERVREVQSLFEGEYGRLRHVAQAPDGSLWVLTNNHDGRGDPGPDDDRILRVAPPGW